MGGSIIALESVPKSETSKYGVIDYLKRENNVFPLKGIVEKPDPEKAPSNLSVIGRYILDFKIFDYLNKQKVGFGGEVQLTDAIQNLIKKDKVFGLEFEGVRYDCGSKLGFIKANIGFGLSDKDIKKELTKYLKNL